jgi:hypothetical protein
VTDLTRHETAWLEGRRRDAERAAAEGAPARSLTGRIAKACGIWGQEAAWIGQGLVGATVTLPPPRRQTRGQRRTSGPSDPTGAQVHATHDTVSREAETFAHLTGPCLLDGTKDHDRCCGAVLIAGCRGFIHTCPQLSAVEVAERCWTTNITAVITVDGVQVDLDATTVVDGLMGTPTSSPASFQLAVARAVTWHNTAAAKTLDGWRDRYREGVESSELETAVVAVEGLARRLRGQAGRLADWSGRRERECRTGCGAAVADHGPAANRGGAACGRCRKRKHDERVSA